VRTVLRKIYTKPLEEDVPGIVANPALRLPKPGGDEHGRDRVLSDDEIRQLWTVLEDVKRLPRRGVDDEETAAISPMIARGLQVLLLTGQRPGEVFKMRWAHLDLEARWWEMPESATKNRVAHRVPLTERVVALLEEAKAQGPDGSRWVFAGIKGGSVAARALKAGAELGRAIGEDGKPLLSFSFHRHDLRRTCATNLAKAGVQRQTISRVLNHVDRGPRATQVYQRYEFDAEKRAALEAWDWRFVQILGPPAAQVVAFQRR
jgi:integrase